MHLVLDPAENAAHGDWLRCTPGAYEWWYFDAVSDDAAWSLACIWFLGNPFSPYYRLAALGEQPDPYHHNALFFALHRHGRLYAYHFTRFPRTHICADETRPATLQFGPNSLSHEGHTYRLRLADENANRRALIADILFTAPDAALARREKIPPPAPPFARGRGRKEGDRSAFSVSDSSPFGRGGEVGSPHPLPSEGEGRRLAAGERGLNASQRASSKNAPDTHFWLPAAPTCRVVARVTLREARNSGAEHIAFAGHGYHDHNWGTLPFAAEIRDWYWARASLGGESAALLYHVNYHRPRLPASHLLLFEQGVLTRHDPQAVVSLGRPRVNAFGMACATHLQATSGDVTIAFSLNKRLDSSPFYVRALCQAALTADGRRAMGDGIAEYFRPRLLGTRLAASATQARIVGP